MITLLVSLLIIGALIFIWTNSIYNGLIESIKTIHLKQQEIEKLLDKRFKLLENLIHSVKNYPDYERSVLKDVLLLRNRSEIARLSQQASEHMALEDEISKIAANLDHIFEQHVEFKAGKQVMQIQEDIVNAESKLAYAKQVYNDNVTYYNSKQKLYIYALITRLFPTLLRKKFISWD